MALDMHGFGVVARLWSIAVITYLLKGITFYTVFNFTLHNVIFVVNKCSFTRLPYLDSETGDHINVVNSR